VPPASGPSARWARLDRPPLRVEALRHALVQPAGVFSRLDLLDEVPSTNAELARRAADGALPDLAVLTTEHQTAGRGRLGRTWTTPARATLATSILLRPVGPDGASIPTERWSWLPLLAGVAVTHALRTVVGVDAGLKWPNDVLVRASAGASEASGSKSEAASAAKKVCGVLSEVIRTPEGPAVVLGFGVNVTQTREELPVPTATSLLLEGAATTDRDTILRACLRAIGSRYVAWRNVRGDAASTSLVAEAREDCWTLGQRVRVELPGGRDPLVGEAEGLDDGGRLLVRTTGGELVPVAAGDVVHLRPEGAR
jgi:BirA family biotin operon repressor/biotin-[acetyl-CoA-carboxylase] ligase